MVQTHIVEHHSSCGNEVGKVLTGIGAGMIVSGGIAKYVSPKIGGILIAGGVVFNVLGSIIDSITDCDDYEVKVLGPKVPVIHKVTKNFREYRTEEIDRYICDAQKTETAISGYRPYECCKNENGKKIKVLDPKCVSHNTECSIKMTILAEKIQFENETMFGEFQDMMTKGKQATDAQLEANKLKRFDVAAKQLELARARFKQHVSSRKAINLPRVKQSEELGLNLGQNMEKLEGKALVFVDSLEFSVSVTKSSTKTRFPLTAYVRTFKGSHKKIQFSMDFKQEDDSLALASKFVVETLFGTSHSRRRRSVRDKFIISKNDRAFPLERHECLFSKEAHILFADIIESMDFAIRSNKKLEEAMSTSIRGLQKLPVENDNDDNTSYSDIIQFLKDVQLNSSGAISWNDTLNDVRGFLDVLTQKKNFTDCSGIQDCTDFFFDSLEEVYGMEYHPRAIEIKMVLQSLNKIISSILRENLTMSMLEGKLSQARFLINNSNDEIILCGKKPTIERNSPVEVVALHGGAVRLVCEAKSTLEVEYMWIKNGQPLEGANSTILELRNVTENSEGAYKCQASNKRGSTVSNVTIVIVHQRPQITEQPLDAQKLVGHETFWMVCNSTGVPQPLTEWFFIPIAIKGKNQDAVRLNTTGPVLQMRNMTTTNSGFYYCNVSNLHGAVQSRMARLDVLRFVPGVPRIALSLKLKQCMSASSPKNSGPYYCNRTTTEKSQEIGAAGYQYIIRKLLEHMSWPVEKTDNEHYKPFPDAAISFILNGNDHSVAEGKKLEALNEFSLSRRRMGNSLKKLYSSLEDEKEKIKWKNLTISGDKDTLVVGFPSQKCPNGTRSHENGFLCVYCPPGSYEVGNRTCHECPAGTYQPNDGSTECLQCPYRVSYTEPGALRESQCIDISIPCKLPQTDVKRAQMPNEMKNLYRSGETIVLGCKPGYRVVGNATLECNEGNWTKSEFYCEKTCFPPWTELSKRCYLVIQASTHRWKDTSAQCLRLRSHMVTISSEKENAFVGQLAKVYLEEKKWGQVQMWLGLRKTHAQGQFQWVDGSPLEGYTNWTPGEPNNSNGTVENCVPRC